jgi:hypothetical protein
MGTGRTGSTYGGNAQAHTSMMNSNRQNLVISIRGGAKQRQTITQGKRPLEELEEEEEEESKQ